jgi:hypothetical protein
MRRALGLGGILAFFIINGWPRQHAIPSMPIGILTKEALALPATSNTASLDSIARVQVLRMADDVLAGLEAHTGGPLTPEHRDFLRDLITGQRSAGHNVQELILSLGSAVFLWHDIDYVIRNYPTATGGPLLDYAQLYYEKERYLSVWAALFPAYESYPAEFAPPTWKLIHSIFGVLDIEGHGTALNRPLDGLMHQIAHEVQLDSALSETRPVEAWPADDLAGILSYVLPDVDTTDWSFRMGFNDKPRYRLIDSKGRTRGDSQWGDALLRIYSERQNLRQKGHALRSLATDKVLANAMTRLATQALGRPPVISDVKLLSQLFETLTSAVALASGKPVAQNSPGEIFALYGLLLSDGAETAFVQEWEKCLRQAPGTAPFFAQLESKPVSPQAKTPSIVERVEQKINLRFSAAHRPVIEKEFFDGMLIEPHGRWLIKAGNEGISWVAQREFASRYRGASGLERRPFFAGLASPEFRQRLAVRLIGEGKDDEQKKLYAWAATLILGDMVMQGQFDLLRELLREEVQRLFSEIAKDHSPEGIHGASKDARILTTILTHFWSHEGIPFGLAQRAQWIFLNWQIDAQFKTSLLVWSELLRQWTEGAIVDPERMHYDLLDVKILGEAMRMTLQRSGIFPNLPDRMPHLWRDTFYRSLAVVGRIKEFESPGQLLESERWVVHVYDAFSSNHPNDPHAPFLNRWREHLALKAA